MDDGSDLDGIYQFNQQAASVDKLVEMPVQKAAILLDSFASGYFLLVQSGEKLHLFALDDASGKNNWFKTESSSANLAGGPAPKLTAKKIHIYPATPPELEDMVSGFGLTKSGNLVIKGQSFFASVTKEKDATWEISPYIAPFTQYQQPLVATCALALMPTGLFLFSIVACSINELANGRSLLGVVSRLGLPVGESLTLFCVVVVIATVISVAMTIYVCRRRGLSLSATINWALATVLLGLAGPLTVIAIYPRIVYAPCTRCNRSRRVDLQKCEHCSSEWEPLPVEGIEIIDRTASLVRV